ncbi:putative reverse transcriptase domain-containing protein, partial [Tanacetum coccineum]
IIIENVIPPNHVDDLLIVEPNQPDDVPVIPEPVLVDDDEDSKEEKFKEEEEPQEEEDYMEVDIEEDENEPELTFPYEEADPLNPPPPAYDSKPEDVIEVEDTVESEDETVPASVHKVGKSSTAPFLREDSDGLLPGLMRRDINSLFGRMTSLSRRLCGHDCVQSSMEEGIDAMENLVRKLGNADEKAECNKLKKELEEARFSNTLLRMQNERVKRDLYWTRVQAHEFYREMVRRGLVFEERPNKAIDVPVEDEESPSFEPRGSLQNARNDESGSGQARGQVTAPVVRECTFVGFIKCNPDNFCGTEGAVELRRWVEKTKMTFGISECAKDKKVKFAVATLRGPALTYGVFPAEELQRMENELWNLKVKEYNMVAYTQRFNELALMCPSMVEPESVKVDAYIRGLTDNIKGEVTSSRPVNLNDAVRMAHKLMEQKSQAMDERILEGKKKNWENFQRNARAMITALTEKKVSSGSLPICERCFTRHDGPYMIKCHKCGKVGHKSRYCKEKSVATGANAQPVWTCYDCREQGHTRNRCPKKVKQEETEEVRGRAYAIKDAEPQGPNVVT